MGESGMVGTGALRDRIAQWVTKGYRVVSETPTSAQLVKPKKFNAAEFIAMPIYLIEYFGQKERTVYLSVADDGTVNETGSALEVSRYQRQKNAPMRVKLMWTAVVLGAFVVLYVVMQAVNGRL